MGRVSDDEVAKVRAATIKAMRAAGLRPGLIYAYEQTRLIVTRENLARPVLPMHGAAQPDRQ